MWYDIYPENLVLNKENKMDDSAHILDLQVYIKAREANRSVYDIISHLRESSVDRICSFNNNRMVGHLRWKYGCENKYQISDRGKGILWLRLKFGIIKALNLGSQENDTTVDVSKHNMNSDYYG